MSGNTIIAAPFDNGAMRAMVYGADDFSDLEDLGNYSRLFKIRAAHSRVHRQAASILINRMYSWRGYEGAALDESAGSRITLVAAHDDATLGTLSAGFDSPESGLLVEQAFPDEVAALRREGHKLCEFIKLAVDGEVKSKRVLAYLFHIAYIYAYRINGYDKLLIEINPRHLRFYEKMLGFRKIAGARTNPRVNAPAVLLCLDFRHAHRQIGLHGGRPELFGVEKSMYPYFLSVAEEATIVGRLRAMPFDDEPAGALRH